MRSHRAEGCPGARGKLVEAPSYYQLLLLTPTSFLADKSRASSSAKSNNMYIVCFIWHLAHLPPLSCLTGDRSLLHALAEIFLFNGLGKSTRALQLSWRANLFLKKLFIFGVLPNSCIERSTCLPI